MWGKEWEGEWDGAGSGSSKLKKEEKKKKRKRERGMKRRKQQKWSLWIGISPATATRKSATDQGFIQFSTYLPPPHFDYLLVLSIVFCAISCNLLSGLITWYRENSALFTVSIVFPQNRLTHLRITGMLSILSEMNIDLCARAPVAALPLVDGLRLYAFIDVFRWFLTRRGGKC